MKEKINELLHFLNTQRIKMAPYTIAETKRYYRIVADGRSAYCFIVKDDFSNKTIGSVKKGDLMKPATWMQPAKHARGNLFNKSTWEDAFDDYGMRYLR